MSKKKSKTVISIGVHDRDVWRHFVATNGITRLEIMPFASFLKRGIPIDVEFSSLLEADIPGALFGCVSVLSEKGYFSRASSNTSYDARGEPVVSFREWLNFNVLDTTGAPLFEPLSKTRYEPIPDPFTDSEVKVLAIALAARLIWENECKKGAFLSEAWFCAKIIEVWFWPGGSAANRSMLIGQLYSELNTKVLHEENAMRGKQFSSGGTKSKQASETASSNAQIRKELVRQAFESLTEEELATCRTTRGKAPGRLKAKAVARLILDK